MLTTLEFASCYVYSNRGTSSAATKSRVLRDRVKAGSAEWLPKYASRVAQIHRDERAFEGWFGPDVTLVPVPGSAPRRAGSLWVPERIAQALCAEGLGREVLSCLERMHAVPKSAYALPGERPTAAVHHDSMSVDRTLLHPQRIVLVDDVVTRGCTLIGAASRVADAFPAAEIRAFALVRFRGLVPDIMNFLDPCVGAIMFDGRETQREP